MTTTPSMTPPPKNLDSKEVIIEYSKEVIIEYQFRGAPHLHSLCSDAPIVFEANGLPPPFATTSTGAGNVSDAGEKEPEAKK